jgi:hypothetical protein
MLGPLIALSIITYMAMGDYYGTYYSFLNGFIYLYLKEFYKGEMI